MLTPGESEMTRLALVRYYDLLKAEKRRFVEQGILTERMLDHYDGMLADIKGALNKL